MTPRRRSRGHASDLSRPRSLRMLDAPSYQEAHAVAVSRRQRALCARCGIPLAVVVLTEDGALLRCPHCDAEAVAKPRTKAYRAAKERLAQQGAK